MTSEAETTTPARYRRAIPATEVTLVGDRWEGDPERPEVVLLHGGGQTRHSWRRTAERLAAAGWTVTSVDQRGHGESGRVAPDEYTIDGFVADVVAIAAAAPAPPIFVGASIGGIAALLAAAEHPNVASGLVLVDIALELESDGVDRVREFMLGGMSGFASLDEVAEAVAAYSPGRDRPPSHEGLRRNVRQAPDGRWYWHWDPNFLQVAEERRTDAHLERLRAAAARLEMPVLAIFGSESEVVSGAAVADLLRRVRGSRAVEVPDVGHMLAGSDNDLFAGSLEGFFAEVAERAASSPPPRKPNLE